MYFQGRNRDPDVENKVWTHSRGKRRSTDWETGIDIYALPFVK